MLRAVPKNPLIALALSFFSHPVFGSVDFSIVGVSHCGPRDPAEPRPGRAEVKRLATEDALRKCQNVLGPKAVILDGQARCSEIEADADGTGAKLDCSGFFTCSFPGEMSETELTALMARFFDTRDDSSICDLMRTADYAAWALPSIGKRSEIYLLNHFDDEEPSTRARAAFGISLARLASRAAVDRLFTLLDDASEDVRDAATSALRSMGSAKDLDAAYFIARLDPLFGHSASAVRSIAYEIVGGLGARAASLKPRLFEACRTERQIDFAASPVDALFAIGVDSRDRTHIEALLKDPAVDPEIRRQLMELMKVSFPVPAEPIPPSPVTRTSPEDAREVEAALGTGEIFELTAALQSENEAVAEAAISALSRADRIKVLDAVGALLEDMRPQVRERALKLIWWHGAEDLKTHAALFKMLETFAHEAEPSVSTLVAILKRIVTEEDVEALLRILEDPARHPMRRSAIVQTLGALGPPAKGALPALYGILQEDPLSWNDETAPARNNPVDGYFYHTVVALESIGPSADTQLDRKIIERLRVLVDIDDFNVPAWLIASIERTLKGWGYENTI